MGCINGRLAGTGSEVIEDAACRSVDFAVAWSGLDPQPTFMIRRRASRAPEKRSIRSYATER